MRQCAFPVHRSLIAVASPHRTKDKHIGNREQRFAGNNCATDSYGIVILAIATKPSIRRLNQELWRLLLPCRRQLSRELESAYSSVYPPASPIFSSPYSRPELHLSGLT